MNNQYKQQVDLLLDILPYVAEESCFALKGGTALNLFYWNMPRLSVDIDLTLVQSSTRDADIQIIDRALLQIKLQLETRLKAKVKKLNNYKLLVYKNGSQPIKIEPSINLRGSVFPIENRDLQENVENTFNKSVLDIPTLSFADLYGGKIVAALDRQHPRDLFDIKMLFEHGGIDERIIVAFIVYLLSSNKPIHEILNPNMLGISHEFKEHFEGMTTVSVGLNELLNIREQLLYSIKEHLTSSQKEFIYSVKMLEPKWNLFEIPECQHMSGIQWKLKNIQRLKDKDASKYKSQSKKLSDILGLS